MLELEGLQGLLLSGCMNALRGRREQGCAGGQCVTPPHTLKKIYGIAFRNFPLLSLRVVSLQQRAVSHRLLLALLPACSGEAVRGETCRPSLCASGISSQTCSSWNPRGHVYLCQLLAVKTVLSSSQCGQGSFLLATPCNLHGLWKQNGISTLILSHTVHATFTH